MDKDHTKTKAMPWPRPSPGVLAKFPALQSEYERRYGPAVLEELPAPPPPEPEREHERQ
jgi:hypothetical protein